MSQSGNLCNILERKDFSWNFMHFVTVLVAAFASPLPGSCFSQSHCDERYFDPSVAQTPHSVAVGFPVPVAQAKHDSANGVSTVNGDAPVVDIDKYIKTEMHILGEGYSLDNNKLWVAYSKTTPDILRVILVSRRLRIKTFTKKVTIGRHEIPAHNEFVLTLYEKDANSDYVGTSGKKYFAVAIQGGKKILAKSNLGNDILYFTKTGGINIICRETGGKYDVLDENNQKILSIICLERFK